VRPPRTILSRQEIAHFSQSTTTLWNFAAAYGFE
jgi:hypothetical protein